jgi:hypothetical protein
MDGSIILKQIRKKIGVKTWKEFIWLRTGFSGGLL